MTYGEGVRRAYGMLLRSKGPEDLAERLNVWREYLQHRHTDPTTRPYFEAVVSVLEAFS